MKSEGVQCVVQMILDLTQKVCMVFNYTDSDKKLMHFPGNPVSS
jgi:hypothetical protein